MPFLKQEPFVLAETNAMQQKKHLSAQLSGFILFQKKFALVCVENPNSGHWGEERSEGEQNKSDGMENQPGEPGTPNESGGDVGCEAGALVPRELIVLSLILTQ